MARSQESAPMYPSETIKGAMQSGGNNDWERNHDFRGETQEITDANPDYLFSNPAYNNGSRDESIALDAPNAYVELANLQNRHDDDERVATEERIAEIGEPNFLSISKRRELGKLVDRLQVINPNGSMEEDHKEFIQNNFPSLVENAKAHAERDGVEITTGDRAA